MPKTSVKSVKTPEISSKTSKGYPVIRNIYLYLVAVIGLVTFVVGSVGMIDNVLQNYVFHVGSDIYMEPYPSKNGICAQSFPAPADGKTMITPTTQEVETCVKTQKEQQEQNQRNISVRQFSTSIAQMVIGLPLWLFHWMIIQKDYRKKRGELA